MIALEAPSQFFTLMLIDPTKELNTTTPNSNVHWLVVNIHAENISSGHVLVEYMPPMPHATKNMFLALLYKQANRTEQVKNITGLFGQIFTLMLIDPTKELNTTTPNSNVHWLVVNIHAENISSGDVLVEYMPPMPHATKNMFLALLYKQANRTEQVKNITGLFGYDCPRSTKYE
ncbi:uncharacterized protein LOC124256147 [Haliotis rubra]|uniref:uncharacterized protein LOC124256147 n=1 Tax=Haliotis rubra TaxID=36100 RepID=UPI001EE602E6|nr:uncharacterized protein LOC124256147 [Haliotis rubra]